MAKAKTGGRLIESADQFYDLVLNSDVSRPVLVFYTAPWCAPCRLQVQVVKEVMKQFSDQIDVLEVCTDDVPEIASESGVVSIPTIQMYSKGELVDTIVGLVAKTVLASSTEKVIEEAFAKYGLDEPNGQ